MKEKAKALVGSNKNEPPAARKLEVSLDRADNVIEGGPSNKSKIVMPKFREIRNRFPQRSDSEPTTS